MIPNGRIELIWGDGEHVFNIAKIAQALELEEKCGCGAREIFNRIREERWHVNDLRETIRLGLIGGGISPRDALVLVHRYFDERPWQESAHVALVILMSAIAGVPRDDVGKKPEAERAEDQESPSTTAMDDLSVPPSTASAPPSDGHPDRPTKSRSGKSAHASTVTIEPTPLTK